jgi:hypothetical protein
MIINCISLTCIITFLAAFSITGFCGDQLAAEFDDVIYEEALINDMINRNLFKIPESAPEEEFVHEEQDQYLETIMEEKKDDIEQVDESADSDMIEETEDESFSEVESLVEQEQEESEIDENVLMLLRELPSDSRKKTDEQLDEELPANKIDLDTLEADQDEQAEDTDILEDLGL